MNTTQETFAPIELSKPTDRPTGSNVNPIIGEILERHFPDSIRNQARRHMVVTFKPVDFAEEVSRKAWINTGNRQGLPSVQETAKMVQGFKREVAERIARVTSESNARIEKNKELLKP